MRAVTACPGCGGASFRPYSFVPVDERHGAIHFAQSRCRRCDLIFSNPVADPHDLQRFYAGEYYEDIERVYNANRSDLEQLVRERVEGEVEGLRNLIVPYVASGTFFEIGAGFGNLLDAARRLGFSVAGVEPSERAARFARETLGLEDVKHGMFHPDDWPEAFCDVIYSYHVIEHVFDLHQFVGGMFRMLKPGGLVFVGTENHHNAWVQYRRARNLLKGRRLPEFQTSDHHTFYFSDRSLRHVFGRHRFEVLKTLVYTHSLEEKLKTARFRSVWSRALFYALHYGDVWTGRGNRVLIWCRKPADW